MAKLRIGVCLLATACAGLPSVSSVGKYAGEFQDSRWHLDVKPDSTFCLSIEIPSHFRFLVTGHWADAGTADDGVFVRVRLEETDGQPWPQPIAPLVRLTKDEAVLEGWSSRPVLKRVR